MMFASIESELTQILVGLSLFVGLGIGILCLGISILFALVRAVGRQIKKGYVEEGGAKGLATKVAAKTTGKILKRVILGK